MNKLAKTAAALLLMLCMLFGSAITAAPGNGSSFGLTAYAATIVDEGLCCENIEEENVKWTLDDEGTLTISGTGKMKDYNTGGMFRYGRMWDCDSVKKVVINSGVTTVGCGAFEDCVNLTSVKLASSVKDIGMFAFSGCTSLPGISLHGGIESIGQEAFSGCTSLKTVTIPDKVKKIEQNTFNGCSGLTSVSIPAGVTSIGDGAFSGCSKLISVPIPAGVTSIGDGAFSGCSKLTSVPIPAGVTSIGDGAFKNCTGLQKIVYGGKKTDWANISLDVNADNTSLFLLPVQCSDGTIYITAGSKADGWEITGDRTLHIYSDKAMGFTDYWSIPWSGFNSKIKAIDIQNGVTVIGEYAFSGCYEVTEITIPDSVKSIGRLACENCGDLQKASLPGTAELGPGIFDQCHNLKKLTFTGTGSIEGIEDILYDSAVEELVISDGLTGTLGNLYGYGDKNSLKKVYIGKGITGIGEGVFSSARSLEKLELSEGLTHIDDFAFSGCGALDEINIPGSVKTIGRDAFSASGAKNIKIPQGVTSIGNGAFGECEDLRSVDIASSVKVIESSAFSWCKRLERVTFREGLETLGIGVFLDCPILTAVELPESLSAMQVTDESYLAVQNTFDSTTVKDVFYHGTQEQWDKIKTTSNKAGLNNADIHFYKLKLTDKQNRAVVYTSRNEKNISGNTVLTADDVSASSSLPAKVKAAAAKTGKKYTVYNVRLKNGGTEVRPSQPVTLMLREPAGYRRAYSAVFHIAEDGKATKISARYWNGYFYFDTSNTGYYCLSETDHADMILASGENWFIDAGLTLYITGPITYLKGNKHPEPWYKYDNLIENMIITDIMDSIGFDFDWYYSLHDIYYQGTSSRWNSLNIYGVGLHQYDFFVNTIDMHYDYNGYPFTPHIPGDINNDGTTDPRDLTRMMKHLSGENSEVSVSALDTTGDGINDARDLVRLMKYLSGENVPLA